MDVWRGHLINKNYNRRNSNFRVAFGVSHLAQKHEVLAHSPSSPFGAHHFRAGLGSMRHEDGNLGMFQDMPRNPSEYGLLQPIVGISSDNQEVRIKLLSL